MESIAAKIAMLLTLYRIAAAPVVAAMALAGQRDAFYVLLIVSLATDLLDGPLARWCGVASPLGAKLDTIADASTVLAAVLGLWVFERTTLLPDIAWLGLFLASYLAAAAACLLKFGVLPAYHLYLSKSGAILSGAFIVWLYLAGYSRVFFIALACIGTLASCESVLVTWRLERFRTDVGSLLSLVRRGR